MREENIAAGSPLLQDLGVSKDRVLLRVPASYEGLGDNARGTGGEAGVAGVAGVAGGAGGAEGAGGVGGGGGGGGGGVVRAV